LPYQALFLTLLKVMGTQIKNNLEKYFLSKHSKIEFALQTINDYSATQQQP
jgi:hypothetical protein